MATQETGATRTTSLPRRIKREHSNDQDDEDTRRVSQRTDNKNTAANGVESSVAEYLKTISCTTVDKTQAMYNLANGMLYGGRTEEQRRANQEFLRLGGPLTVVVLMNQHQDYEILQNEAMRALQNATCSPNFPEIRKVVAEVDGIQAILRAMTKYSSSKYTQRNGVGALLNLSLLPANAKLLVCELNGIGIVTNAMTRFSNDEETVKWGCMLLCNLAQVDSGKQSMFDAKAASILASAIESHKDNPDIQRFARNALKSLLW